MDMERGKNCIVPILRYYTHDASPNAAYCCDVWSARCPYTAVYDMMQARGNLIFPAAEELSPASDPTFPPLPDMPFLNNIPVRTHAVQSGPT